MQSNAMQVPHAVTPVESNNAVWIGGPESLRYEVVGEEYAQPHMQRIAASVRGRADVPLSGWLVPEPGGVAVWVMGSKVGYLQHALATVWNPLVTGLGARYNLPVACQATLDLPSAANHGVIGIAVWLPAVGAPLPAVAPPSRVIDPSVSNELVLVRAELAKTKGDLDSAVAKASQLTTARDELAKGKLDAEGALAKALAAAAPSEELARVQAELQKLSVELQARRGELGSVEEAIEIQSFGFYKPRHGFESSAQYVARLAGIRDEQKQLIKEGSAAPCDTTWTVGGSAAEGKRMVKQQAKLMLRAFNGESDAAIAKVRYDNIVTMQSRLEKAYGDINKLGEVQRVFISRRFLDLKLAELHLVHEHREKVEEEKQEQRRIRDQMREEQKAQAEIEKAQTEAAREEAASAAALEKARAELAAQEATSKQHEKLEALVGRLENELKDALDRKANAIARAQLTRSGHVYVLSNIGSFGEDVYKIGLTRRLDPFERVEELGDASVPFPFDVHAIIFAEDAPTLEARLHQAFAARRINLVNHRKEYFRVTLNEIQAEVTKHHGVVSFTLLAEAEEYRKTLAARSGNAVPAAPDAGSLVARPSRFEGDSVS